MTAVVLCPGPSLAESSPPYSSLTIGVNRAVLAHPCDWWIFQDWKRFRDGEPKGRPIVCTTREAARRLGMLPHFAIDDLECPVDQWSLFTAPAALVLAYKMGGNQIEVYGADWSDEPDFDGVRVVGCIRDPERWKKEVPIWNAVVGWLHERGITVNRITDGIR